MIILLFKYSFFLHLLQFVVCIFTDIVIVVAAELVFFEVHVGRDAL
jgi:hypothetical protein